jgi:hypothetical protein
MSFETRIKELSDRFFADTRAPDITGFVDQLFHVAAETGTVACVFQGDKKLRFFVRPRQIRTRGAAPGAAQAPSTFILEWMQQKQQMAQGGPGPAQAPPTFILEHEAARSVLRMICARLAVICNERTATDISPYGDKADLDYDVQDHKHWSISFTNTPDRQEFLIEAV